MNVQTSSLLEAIETLPASSSLLLHEVSWAAYEDLLALHQTERIVGRDTIDLATDPPPELVVEVDISDLMRAFRDWVRAYQQK